MMFSILVCIKSVPDLSGGAEEDRPEHYPEGQGLSWRMNLYDAHALEAALTIKDAAGDVIVTALSVGPDRVRNTIRRAMAMGADRGVHLHVETEDPLPPETVAAAVARFAQGRNDDLILTGAISEDAMQGLTGPMIAAALDLPCATAAMAIDPHREIGALIVRCEMEGGLAEIVRLACPALVTVQTGLRSPRYPSLSNALRARRQALERVEYAASQLPAAPTKTLEIDIPQRAFTRRIIEGTLDQKADSLLQLFNEKGWLR